ncbi:MarR family transcriptional regulator [Kribbella jejuensis]|uniref:MarR family winged helix-turn-helix transcriptional regulator n=1 Tax=Kribbella jejuensis TaxID=236068 RepID=UPI00163B1662|nr:MarR family transcriptional regulator [Kribbella jejuensis]
MSETWAEQLDTGTGLIQLMTLVQGIYANVSERHELTPVQAKLLCVLIGGPRGMAELAQLFGVEKAALTGLMDRIEKRGLAVRSAVPGDRRAVQVTLTEEGRRAASAFHREMGEVLSRLIDPIPEGDREQFRSTVQGIIMRCRTSPSGG